LGVYAEPFTNYIQPSLTDFPGLFIGIDSLAKGLGFYNDNFDNFILNSTGGQNIVLRVNNLSNTLYNDILRANYTGIAIGTDAPFSDIYSLSILGGGIIDELE